MTTIPDDVIIAEQLKYTPPNEVLTRAQYHAHEYLATIRDDLFFAITTGLKSAYDMLDSLVYDDGLNELAGTLEVITLLCSVDNQRYYDLLKDPKYADLLTVMTGAK